MLPPIAIPNKDPHVRVLRRTLIAIVLLIAVLVGVAFLLPREITVERSVVIDAPAAEIFPHVNSLKAQEAWSPWLHRDPEATLLYEGPKAGAGSTLIWSSDNPDVGSGTHVITASETDRRVDSALDFGPMGTAVAWITLDPAGGESTEVSWGFTTDMGLNPVARWMGLMMEDWVGADYEDGLNRLKTLVETG